MYQKSIINTIKKRKSVRTYENHSILKEDYEKINQYLKKENLIGPNGNKVRFEIVSVNNNLTDQGIKIGTYGFIKNPQAYLVGIVEHKKEALIDFGYVFEKLILFLTENDIGTCWLGGTFTRTSFEKELSYDDKEIIPCIVSIGYPRNKQRLFEKTLRTIVKADNKKPWKDLFFKGDFRSPIEEPESGIFHPALEMVRLGPSASNKQPWRIVLSNDLKTSHFYFQKNPNYSGNKLGFEMQRIDIGIAMSHFELTCYDQGLKGEWTNDNPNFELINDDLEYIMSWKLT